MSCSMHHRDSRVELTDTLSDIPQHKGVVAKTKLIYTWPYFKMLRNINHEHPLIYMYQVIPLAEKV